MAKWQTTYHTPEPTPLANFPLDGFRDMPRNLASSHEISSLANLPEQVEMVTVHVQLQL
jgi:hypothetical protein